MKHIASIPDEYGYLTCFDTATGQVLWTTNNQAIFNSWAYKLIHYAPENTILLLHNSGVCSISWENGEIQWLNDYGEVFVSIIASEHGDGLAVLYESPNFVAGEPLLRITCVGIDFLSPVDGGVIASTDRYVGYNMQLAFSSDGNSLAGVYRDYDTGGDEIGILVNGQTGGYDSIACPDRGKGRSAVCIQFTPDNNGLVFLHYIEGEEDYYWVDLYDLSAQSFVWSAGIQGADDNEYARESNDAPLAICFPGYILISEDTELHLLDIYSGKYLCSANTEYNVEDIAAVSDATFGFVMNNGGYVLGYLSDALISKSDYDTDSVSYDLNTDGSYSLWNGGFFFDDFGSDGYTVGSEKDCLGYAVVLSLDRMKLTIIRPYQDSIDYGQVYGDNFDLLLGSQTTLYGEDLLIGMFEVPEENEIKSYYYVVDTHTLEVKQKIDFSGISFINFLTNGSGYLRWYHGLEGTHVDPISGKETSVLTPDMKFRFPYKGSEIMLSPTEKNIVRLTATDENWMIALTHAGLISWINGSQMTIVPYPEGINLEDSRCPYTDCRSYIFESGHLLVYFEKNVADRQETDSYLYDRNANTWYAWSGDYEPIYALSHPWCVEVGEDSRIIIRKYASEQIVTEVPCIFPPHTIDQISFVLDDRYLLVTTDANLLKIYDLSTAEEVFSYWRQDDSPSIRYCCKADLQNQRVYLYTKENLYHKKGLCIDMRSWTLLTEIDKLAYFDPRSGILVRNQYMPESGYHFMMGKLPSTDELVAYGQEILKQQNIS